MMVNAAVVGSPGTPYSTPLSSSNAKPAGNTPESKCHVHVNSVAENGRRYGTFTRPCGALAGLMLAAP